LTDKQLDLLVALIKGDETEETCDKRVFKGLVNAGYYDTDNKRVTQSGIEASGIPTIRKTIMTAEQGFNYRGVQFPRGTEVLVSFRHMKRYAKRNRELIEGYVKTGATQMSFIRLWRPLKSHFTERLFVNPDEMLDSQTET